MKTFFLKNITISLAIIFVLSYTLLALTQSAPVKKKTATNPPLRHFGATGITGNTGTTGMTGTTGITGHSGFNNYDDRTPEKDKTKYNEQSSNNNRQHATTPQW